jgi:hypothetical protein
VPATRGLGTVPLACQGAGTGAALERRGERPIAIAGRFRRPIAADTGADASVVAR